MADPQAPRNAGESAPSRGDSQLRIVRPPVVLPEGEVASSDESPTIISKHPPLQQSVQKANPNDFFSTNLRGRTLAHFELLEPIGVGGMAAVLRARDRQLDRLVALKILPPDMAKDSENVLRFHQEARAAAKLDHENIARVFFCGEDQDLHFIAFEFVEGDNLRTLLERRGRIPVPQAVRYMLQIAAGLDHAASRGVVHRDIKPSNIIISPSGRAKLVDMGLARNMGPQSDGLTQSGVTLGTFDYISPEQALEPREADTRSDIYSLGCTFYHMLTGQSPIPEGTAAKKLHHHQHVRPIDPRQLNPAIPDDVAAIVGRMMAKDPKDRYQHPVHLVQHLMQVAQKMGAGDDMPEGVLFVDAPLPSAPRKRPVVVTLSALLGLAGILLVLSLVNPGPQPPPPLQPSTGDRGPRDKAADKSGRVNPQPIQVGGAESERDRFTQAFTGQDPKTSFELKDHIDLEKSLEFDNPGEITIKSDPLEPRTITIKYSSQGEWAGLWVKRGHVTFQNIEFELQATVTPRAQVAAIAIAEGAQVTFQKCTFVQTGVKIDRRFLSDKSARAFIPFASVVLLNPENDPANMPEVRFKGCGFKKGQVAVALNGYGKVDADNCAFGEHGALVHLRGNTEKFESRVHFERCTAQVVYGPAFRVDDEARCQLKLDNSIFSCPTAWTANLQDPPDLIRQTMTARPLVHYVGKHNCFHNMNLLLVRPTETGVGHHQIADVNSLSGDSGSVKLPLQPFPWATPEPHKAFVKNAFQLDVKLPELGKLGPVGLEYFVNQGPLEQPRETAPVLAGNKTKIVDPDAPANAPAGVYKTLDQALAYAEPGDEILIKHAAGKRHVEIFATRFKPNADLTFKAHPDFSPILTLAPSDQPDAAFFHLHDQKIHFENLEFELEADQPFNSLSIVSIDGHGSCSFRRCVLTLKESDRVPMSVVSLLKPEKTMEMGVGSRPAMPVLVFQDCFVRGEGKLVSVEGSRAGKLRLENTLVVLGGAAVAVNGKEPKEGSMPTTLAVELNRVSIFLTDSLFQLRAGKSAKALLAGVDAESSLFVALEGKPLITLDTPEGSELKLPGVLSWQGRKNAFSGYDGLKFDQDWRMFAMEMEARHLKVQLGPPPARFSRALPQQFRPMADPAGELLPGPDLDRLPRLTPAGTDPTPDSRDDDAPSERETR